jgi:PAS domain S-box-containing protein
MDLIHRELAPHLDGSAASASEHVVQFYESDAVLVSALTDYVGTGLRAGEAIVVIATQAHLAALDGQIAAEGWDVTTGQFVRLDAAEMLAQLLRHGRPDAARFRELVGRRMARAGEGGRPVRVFGEMVGLLWEDGNYAAAIELEALWNELRTTQNFSLLCAYPAGACADEDGARWVREACDGHSRVIPAESYSGLTSADERLRAIVLLQHRAQALHAEIAERRATEEKLRFLAESLPQKIFTAQPDGEVDYVNPQWMAFTGRSFEEIRGRGWTQIIHPDDVEENVRRWQHSIETGDPFEFEHRVRREDGTYRWHLSRAHAMREETGRVVLWIGSSTDIDDRKRAELERDRARAEAATMLGQIADAVMVIDTTGRTTYLNEAAKQLLGVDTTGVPPERRSEVYGLLTPEGAPFQPEELPSMQAMRERWVIRGVDMLVRRADGTAIPVQENAAPIVADDGTVTGAIATLRDMSVHQQLERQKEDFLAAAAHDLKNPVAVLQGQAQLLKRRVQRGRLEQDRVLEGLEVIESRARMMTSMIDELMDVTRLRMGEALQLNRQATDLAELVREAVDAQRVVAEGHRLVFEAVDGVVPGVVDAARLTRVLGNVLTNAVKYSPEGSEILVRVQHDEDEDGAWAVLAVRDHGVGIPAEDLPHVFDWFFRAGNVTGTVSGTGIGLAGARQIVEQHGGTIEVESQEGTGSTVTVRLPLSSSDTANERSAAASD